MNLREQANRLRQLPLTDVASHLGGKQHPQGRQRWDFQNCAVWVGKGEASHRFYDHRTSHGGGGAIDLTMYVLGCRFKEAVDRLSGLSSGRTASAVRLSAQTMTDAQAPAFFSPPKTSPQHQGIVFDFLATARGLPAHVIEPFMAAGDIYADSRRNAVFVCRAPDGQVTGAELRAPEKLRTRGWPLEADVAWVSSPSRIRPPLSLSSSSPPWMRLLPGLFPASAATIISTAGVLATCPAMVGLAAKLGVSDIVVGYDNDGAGDRASEELMASLKGEDLTIRRRAPWLKDWNDALLEVGKAASHAGTLADGDCQRSLFAGVL